VNNKTGLYSSPATGIPYKVGKVPVAIEYGNEGLSKKLGYTDILNKQNSCFKSQYAGKTAVFVNLGNAVDMMNYLSDYIDGTGYSFVILKMELSGDLYNGGYTGYDVYIGSKIVSIKKVKEQ
jgi:hypothetical protein